MPRFHKPPKPGEAVSVLRYGNHSTPWYTALKQRSDELPEHFVERLERAWADHLASGGLRDTVAPIPPNSSAANLPDHTTKIENVILIKLPGKVAERYAYHNGRTAARYPYTVGAYTEGGEFLGVVADVSAGEKWAGEVWDFKGGVWQLLIKSAEGNWSGERMAEGQILPGAVLIRSREERLRKPKWFGPDHLRPATHR